ncbi:MAG: uracil-DNA glycosylase family protein, partial [Parvibaculales bacterium]
SGATKTRRCSLDNNDPTSKTQRKALEKNNVREEDVLFWNFFRIFGINPSKVKTNEGLEWLEHTEELINICTDLKVIIIFGKGQAWNRMFYFQNHRKIPIISSPHPSDLGMQDGDIKKDRHKAQVRLDAAWKIAKEIVDSSQMERK